MRCLVTGGAGFVGRALVAELLARGHEVVALDPRAHALPGAPRLERLGGSMASPRSVARAMRRAAWVFHLALAGGFEPPASAIAENVRGALALLRAASREGVERFVLFSSTAVYGMPRFLPITEEHGCWPEECPSPSPRYAVTKRSVESLCLLEHREAALPVAVLRPTFVFDEREPSPSPFLRLARRGATIPVLRGDGFSGVHRREAVEAALLLASHRRAVGQVFNAVNPRCFATEEELARLACRRAGRGRVEVREPPGPVWSGPESARRLMALGWRPRARKEDMLRALRLLPRGAPRRAEPQTL